MRDRDTVWTDFFLAALSFGLVIALPAINGVPGLYALLFAALGLAALLGGIWHGWFSGAQVGLGGAIWLGVLTAIGGANLALWLIAADLLGARGLVLVGWGQLAVFLLLALLVSRGFLLASGFSLPPVLLLLAAHGWKLVEGGGSVHAFGLAGFATALAGAALQAARIGLPALGLGHNALYHLMQALALTLVFFSV
ncbi:hypothetical protein [Maritimibacter sp. HL-12]|jgi:hypothetical protein|uniref:DUF6962 family protein n=1 Tax=Maritimibacter sp. HL-12 TaxID=1162418 RepID=UPI000A0F1D95|nr:hypothetical protein [Maritimibacter sp. HL-12]SMH33905.1 hypothetical protein SAMN05661107_0475 [Maritimibacter sp. HL-12]